VRIDFDGLEHRIVALPVEAGGLADLQAGAAGTVFYVERPRLVAAPPVGPGPRPGALTRFDLASREARVLARGVLEYRISGDRKKVLYRAAQGWGIAELGDSLDLDKGRISAADISVRIDPRAEWTQVFDEAWRINRDYFYDPGFHGADWPAMREKHRQFLPHLATRADLNRVIRWMCSELAVGHHRIGGGDSRYEPESIPGGLLGADLVVDQGRYRVAKIYGGLNWSPDLRSPLTEPGVDVEAGEYLLAVDGVDVTAEENLYRFFEKTAGKLVEITVGPSADGAGARTVRVVPIESELALRNRDWIEGNLRKVAQATGGRVAYVYVPNTSRAGHTYFKRYFFPQVDKEAIIVDERFNGGGQVADYYIDHLRRPEIAYWATRYGADIRTPGGSIPGPRVMIIDETAGSGGDLLPWMFRKLGLGTLVGKRTWGGLVGVLGFPVLMDGGAVTAPNLAIWTEDGFVVENEGVPPDVEVEQWPAAVVSGGDPQLEKAIAIALEELAESPPATPERPPFPERVRR
jgi:tricorn protease